MLVPAIDLMDQKVVQLVQGRHKVLEFENVEHWIDRFDGYPLVQVIDLDAAMGNGNNRSLVVQILRRLPAQVGGGVRTVAHAQQLLGAGACRVIVGSALIAGTCLNLTLARQLADACGSEQLIFAIDSLGGKVVVDGWREGSAFTPMEMVAALDSFCAGFLYTHVATEGLMRGFPISIAKELRAATSKQLFVAGGVSTTAEITELDALGAHSVVGMALYTGRIFG